MTFLTIISWAMLICQPTPNERCIGWASMCLVSEMSQHDSDAAFEQCAEMYAPEEWK